MKRIRFFTLVAAASGIGLQAGCQHAPPRTASSAPPAASIGSAYLFGWGEMPVESTRPRGGTSHGGPVTMAPPVQLPLATIAEAPDAFARDRAAILALAGEYRVSFHFMETLTMVPDQTPARPYHSWATEKVSVIEDDGRFISLQHLLVMYFQGEDGSVSEPMVMKHWRQDWTYEPSALHTFRGDRTWQRRRIPPFEAAGAWSQSVWQVDDSPRYSAVGRWTHEGNRSMWTGESTWRPLPRRERTVRRDYDVMEGVHRIVITPTGWLHVQDNWKRTTGRKAGEMRAVYVAHEYGLDRYERITAPSLVAADDYWGKTSGYWEAVRSVWREELSRRDCFRLDSSVDGRPLFEVHFEYAGRLDEGHAYDAEAGARHARETIRSFLSDCDAAGN